MKIAICCRMKYRDLIKETMKNLEAIGIVPLFPNIDYESGEGDSAITVEEKNRLAFEHYVAIDEADKVYFLTPEGYMGTSMKLELGYSIAKEKPVYFSEPTHDMGLDGYVQEFIPVDEVGRFLEV